MRSRAWVLAIGIAVLASSLSVVPSSAAVSEAAVPDVRAFGDAAFYGSTSSLTFNPPIVGIVGTSSSRGYWEATIDGGVRAFGDAQFYGSMGGAHLNQPIVGMATDSYGQGLLARRAGWRDLRVRRRALFRFDGRRAPQPADRRDGGDSYGQGLLARRARRWDLRVR